MKNYKITTLFFLLLALVAGNGCTTTNDPEPLTRTQMLTSSPWVLVAFSVDPAYDILNNGNPITNLYGLLPPCTQDDLLKFKSDNTYTEEEGPTNCNQGDPDIFTRGTWAFSSDENRLTFNPNNGDPLTVNVTELTGSTLRTTSVQNDSSGTYTYTSVYVH